MIVDARGLLCPYPVVRLGRAALSQDTSQEIRLLADDVVALTDVPAWCRMRGAALLAVIDHDGYWEFVVHITGGDAR